MALIKPEMTREDGGMRRENRGTFKDEQNRNRIGVCAPPNLCNLTAAICFYNIKTGAFWAVINRIIHKDTVELSSGRGHVQILPKDESHLLLTSRTAWEEEITRPDFASALGYGDVSERGMLEVMEAAACINHRCDKALQ